MTSVLSSLSDNTVGQSVGLVLDPIHGAPIVTGSLAMDLSLLTSVGYFTPLLLCAFVFHILGLWDTVLCYYILYAKMNLFEKPID